MIADIISTPDGGVDVTVPALTLIAGPLIYLAVLVARRMGGPRPFSERALVAILVVAFAFAWWGLGQALLWVAFVESTLAGLATLGYLSLQHPGGRP